MLGEERKDLFFQPFRNLHHVIAIIYFKGMFYAVIAENPVEIFRRFEHQLLFDMTLNLYAGESLIASLPTNSIE